MEIELITVFTNATTVYTLDGSEPTFASAIYSDRFILTNSALIRTRTYAADFSESGLGDTAQIFIVPGFSLTVMTDAGGTVVPRGSALYGSNDVVSIVARPRTGWQFIEWTGDSTETVTNISVTMDRDKIVRAVFGTSIATTVAGSGALQLNPLRGLYPYGSTVRITATPSLAYQFALWGNAATGRTNPLDFVVTNANPTVSVLFAPITDLQIGISATTTNFLLRLKNATATLNA